MKSKFSPERKHPPKPHVQLYRHKRLKTSFCKSATPPVLLPPHKYPALPQHGHEKPGRQRQGNPQLSQNNVSTTPRNPANSAPAREFTLPSSGQVRPSYYVPNGVHVRLSVEPGYFHYCIHFQLGHIGLRRDSGIVTTHMHMNHM
jgi:hypothetical protein